MTCHHVDKIDVCETKVLITFYGRNSNGTKQCFKVEMPRYLFFWFIGTRCKEAANEIKKRLSEVYWQAAKLFGGESK